MVTELDDEKLRTMKLMVKGLVELTQAIRMFTEETKELRFTINELTESVDKRVYQERNGNRF